MWFDFFFSFFSISRWLKLAAKKFAPLSRTFDPTISALWDLYLETLNFLTLTVTANRWKCWGPSSPKTKPIRNRHRLNRSYLLLPNASTSTQERFSLSPSSSSTSSTGLSTCEGADRPYRCLRILFEVHVHNPTLLKWRWLMYFFFFFIMLHWNLWSNGVDLRPKTP